MSKIRIETGLDGLILQKENELVYQPPWDILTGDWEVREGQGRRLRRLREQLPRLSRAAGRGHSGWKNAHLYAFRTYGFVQLHSGAPTVPLFRGSPRKKGTPTATEVTDALSEAARWIARTTSEKGKFTYLYYPVRDASNFPLHYGVVRHAAAVYGLFAANKILRDDDIGRVAERSLGYMKGISRAPLFHGDALSVRQNGLSFLGATALGLLSLDAKGAENLSAEERETARRYADFLLLMQMDDGAYRTFYLQKLVGYRPSTPPLYFPGESLLALVRYARWADDPKYLEAAKRAAVAQIGDFNESGKPDHWCTQALSELARVDGDPRWAKACFEMGEYYLKSQYGTGAKARFRDYAGGFDNSQPPRATPAASRTEALGAVYDLAAHLRNEKQVRRYGRAILMANRFIMNNQYGDENSYHLRNRAVARGGIRGGLVDNTIRVDYNQHSMIAMLAALRVLEEN
ncbi:MAG: hypothetical protein M5R36_06925 [Deltaproteobacteria bacterium]|nr:hypothetical protein [Deltaproteobacteria bacterium]